MKCRKAYGWQRGDNVCMGFPCLPAMRSTFLITFSTLALSSCVGPGFAAETEKLQSVIRDEYYWEEFTLTKEVPLAKDGRYRLKSVRRSGEVELIALADLDNLETVIVRSMPKKIRSGERLPTIVVGSFDFRKQSATIRELRVRSAVVPASEGSPDNASAK